MTQATARSLYEEAEKHLSYWVEGAIIDFTEELCRVMEEKGVSRAELARRIGSSPAYITKILRGNSNFTLSSMVRVARALEHEVHIHLARPYAMTRWIDELPPARVSIASEATVPVGKAALPAPALIEVA